MVQAAAKNAGVEDFKDYAVLGDDIVIAHDDVAKEYLSICKVLGVEVNLSKSLISSKLIEFAKKLKTPNTEISPIGAGLILESMRNRYDSYKLLIEVMQREVMAFPDILMRISDAPRYLRRAMPTSM
jgi:hypothetical protein